MVVAVAAERSISNARTSYTDALFHPRREAYGRELTQGQVPAIGNPGARGGLPPHGPSHQRLGQSGTLHRGPSRHVAFAARAWSLTGPSGSSLVAQLFCRGTRL